LAHDGTRSIAFWIYATLWLMRWSSKLNLILGVRNYNRDWLPTSLQYVDSYIQRRNMNVLFPISIVLSIWVLVRVVDAAHASVLIDVQIGYTLVATVVTLGALEHLFLMLPIGEGRLWEWASPQKPTSGIAALNLDEQSEAPPIVGKQFQADT